MKSTAFGMHFDETFYAENGIKLGVSGKHSRSHFNGFVAQPGRAVDS